MITVIACVLMVLCLSACGEKKDVSNSKYVGTWVSSGVSLGDEKEQFDEDVFVVLNADGSAEMHSGEETTNCTWVETSNGFKLKGDVKLTFKEEEGGVRATFLGVQLHFVKQ